MQTSIEQQIKNNTELLSETKKRIIATSAKLSEAQSNVSKIQAEIKDTKEKRQIILVRGGDAKSLSDNLKKAEGELELENETAIGLEKFMQELQSEERELHVKIGELPKKLLQFKSLELARLYNEKASELAPIIEELNAITQKLGGSGNNNSNLVVFYPMEGAFEKLPRIFYDPDGVNLETFVSRHPGLYHTNVMLAESEKHFYSWASHQNDLRNGRG